MQATKDFTQDKGIKGYEFGPFVVDVTKSVLLRQGEIVPIGLKAFDLLLALIQHHGEVLMKDELLREVWPDTVVEENNLARTISALRKALDDHLDAPLYIATIPGRGYRFIAPVKEIARENGFVEELSLAAVNGAPRFARGEAPESSTVTDVDSDGLMRRRRINRRIAVAGLLVFLAAVTVGVIIRQTGQPSPEPLPRKLWQLTFDPDLEIEPSLSPDGRLMAYSSDRSGNFDIWVQPVGEGKPVQVTTSPAQDWQADWAPEGNRLVYRSEREGGGLFVVPVLGGNERKISSFGYYPHWSPDGTQILFYGSILRTNTAEIPKLYLVGMDGKPPQEILTSFLADFRSYVASWYPGGGRISVWGYHFQQGNGFWTISLNDGQIVKSEFTAAVVQQLKDAGVWLGNFQWAPSGEAIYFEGVTANGSVKSLWKVAVEADSLRWRAGPERLTAGAGLDGDVVISRTGRHLAFTSRTEKTRIWSFSFNASKGKLNDPGQPITAPGMDAYFPDLSRDGRRLVFVTNRAGRHELRVKSMSDGKETVLIGDDISRSSPRWSRDGKRLAYSREHPVKLVGAQNRWDIATISVDGGDEQPLILPGPLVTPTWDWSIDEQWILVGLLRDSRSRRVVGMAPLSAAPNAAAQMRVVASHPEDNLYQARFSPDGRWISFCAAKMNQAGISTIYVAPTSGGELIRITDGDHFDDKPRWSPDGRIIYFISNRTGFFNVWGIRFDPATGQPIGEPFPVTTFDNPGRMILEDVRTMELALTADRLILPITEQTGNIWILENAER